MNSPKKKIISACVYATDLGPIPIDPEWPYYYEHVLMRFSGGSILGSKRKLVFLGPKMDPPENRIRKLLG
jgi:hypothetical protein